MEAVADEHTSTAGSSESTNTGPEALIDLYLINFPETSPKLNHAECAFYPWFPFKTRQKSLYLTAPQHCCSWGGAAVKVSACTDILSERLRLLCSSDYYFLGIKTQFTWPLWGNSGYTSGDWELSAQVTTGTEEMMGKKKLGTHKELLSVLTKCLEGTGVLQTWKKSGYFQDLILLWDTGLICGGPASNRIQAVFLLQEIKCKGNS